MLDTPPTYKLKDLSGEAILGSIYGEELKLTRKPEYYKIEKILKEKNIGKNRKKYLVKFQGYTDNFNAWIPEEEMKKMS